MLLLLTGLAWADDTTCLACCRAGGLGDCPTELHVRTERSQLEALGDHYELQGAWVLACDGRGVFDPTLRLKADHEPGYGEVLGAGSNPLAIHCFAQACALPAGVCVGAADAQGEVALVGCADQLPVDQRQLAAAAQAGPSAQARVVVIDGRPLVAEPAGSAGVSTPSSTPVASPAPVTGPTPAATPAPTGAPPTLELPADPPDPCVAAPEAVRAESRKRVGSGDDLRISGNGGEALRDYRAALTMDKCNGFAWVSLAQLANDQGRTDLAIRALRNGTRLLPNHPGAWLMLARAYESFGQRGMAAEAYRRATEIAPGNAEAIEGYMRTR